MLLLSLCVGVFWVGGWMLGVYTQDTDADRLGRELAVADKIGSGERMGGGRLSLRKIEE